MDNFRLDVQARRFDDLGRALDIAFSEHCPGNKATHWRDVKVKVKRKRIAVEYPAVRRVLVLYWTRPEKKANRFPGAGLDSLAAANLVRDWLRDVPDAEVGQNLDHDGSNVRAFRVFTDKTWGHVLGSHYGICAVEAVWGWCGK